MVGSRDGRGGVPVALLAGGLGRRIGSGKPSVVLAGRPLISYPLEAARSAGLEAVVVAKRDTMLPSLDERVLYEPDAPVHPLCGIVAALHDAGGPVIAVGCDMPFVTGELLQWLAELAGECLAEGAPGALAPVVAGGLQPLPAVYSPAYLDRLEDALAEELPLRAAFETLEVGLLAEEELARFGSPERLCFSVNDASDLERAEGWLARG